MTQQVVSAERARTVVERAHPSLRVNKWDVGSVVAIPFEAFPCAVALAGNLGFRVSVLEVHDHVVVFKLHDYVKRSDFLLIGAVIAVAAGTLGWASSTLGLF